MVHTSCREDYDTLVEEEVCADLLIESIEVLTVLIGEKESYDIFSQNYRQLLVIVALFMMKTTKAEMEQMKKDADQFINLALDTCDKQKSRVIKTQGAKLLEAICDNIDGAVSFITVFCCQAINFALGNKE